MLRRLELAVEANECSQRASAVVSGFLVPQRLVESALAGLVIGQQDLLSNGGVRFQGGEDKRTGPRRSVGRQGEPVRLAGNKWWLRQRSSRRATTTCDEPTRAASSVTTSSVYVVQPTAR